MPKITDKDYYLPEIVALAKIKDFDTGTTEPILIRGVSKKTYSKEDYVVKFKKGPRMHDNSCCFELIASFIAMELEINVAEPAIIDIQIDFVNTLDGKSKINAQKSLGINYGSKYVEGYSGLLKDQKLSPGQYARAAQIFSFDVFISNIDRRAVKPNMISDGENILLFDHELAFSFIYAIIKNPTPWKLMATDITWIKDHYFYSTLNGKEQDFDNFIDKLSTLDEIFWNKLYQLIPVEWRGDHISQIKNNLSLFIQNKTVFKEELKRILS